MVRKMDISPILIVVKKANLRFLFFFFFIIFQVKLNIQFSRNGAKIQNRERETEG